MDTKQHGPLTPEQEDAFADLGADVASGSMTSAEAETLVLGAPTSAPPPATGAAAITEQVQRVHSVRQELQHRAEALSAARRDFDLHHADLMLDIKEWALRVEAAEMALKAQVLAHYKLTQEKKPTAGVEVKIKNHYAVTDAAAALAWAQQSKLCLIPETVDTDALQKIAAVTPLPFVQYDTEPQAQIAKDLAKALGGVA